METIALLSDTELLTRLPVLVRAERAASADVIEHLVEVERRRLYLEQACSTPMAELRRQQTERTEPEIEPLLRAALGVLIPASP